jgi:integrase
LLLPCYPALSKVLERSGTKEKPFCRTNIVLPKGNVKPLKKQKAMGVHLREKKLGTGQVSFYLDIYHNKKRWYEFLEIHISKSRPSPQDKEKRRLANEIRSQRENELIVRDNGLVDKVKRKADFIQWYVQYMNDRNLHSKRNKGLLVHLNNFAGERLMPFNTLTPELIKDFSKYLLTKVGANTAADYIKTMFSALEDAVRRDILLANPIRKIPRHERIKRKPVFRNAFTMDELQLLVNTPCKIKPQFKQAYLFSCFSGLRWSDVNPLRWSEIITKTIDSKEQWFIYFEQEKTEDIEYFPLSGQAISIIKERKLAMRESEEQSLYVFPLVRESDPEKCLMNNKVNDALKKWAEAAGIDPKRMHFHTGRHTFATNVLENSPDGDLWTVSKLLGHKSISATQIYAHVRDSKKKAAIDGLPMLKTATTIAA